MHFGGRTGVQVTDVVVLGTPFRRPLHLDRDVLNAEVADGDLPQAAAQGFEFTARILGIDQDVGGERVVAGYDAPDMDVVNQRDALQPLHLTAQIVHVDMIRGAFEQRGPPWRADATC